MKCGLKTSFLIGNANARLEQLWTTVAVRGLSVFNSKQVAVLVGKAFFITLKTWKRLYLPFKIQMGGGTTVDMALQKEGLIVGLSITKGGQLQFNACNTIDQVIHLTLKALMANVWAKQSEVKYLSQNPKVLCI